MRSKIQGVNRSLKAQSPSTHCYQNSKLVTSLSKAKWGETGQLPDKIIATSCGRLLKSLAERKM